MAGPQLSQPVFESVLASLSSGLFIIEGDGRIAYANEAFSTILGVSTADCLGRGWGEVFIDGESNLEFNQIIVDVISDEPRQLIRDVPYDTPDGQRLYLSVTSSFLRSEEVVEGIVVLVTDVTALHEMEQERQRLAEEREAGLRAFALSVAHQIRNPAMIMGGQALSLLRRGGDEERMRDFLGSVVEGSERLDRVVRAVTEYTGMPEAQVGTISVADVLHLALEDVVATGENGRVEMKIHEQGLALRVGVDAAMMARAFAAVLQNAVDFCSSGAVAVAVEAGKERDTACVVLTDDGPGFSDEALMLAFDPFYTTKSDGVGMGLSMARRILREHLGTLEIGNTQRGGARVELRIPLCEGCG